MSYEAHGKERRRKERKKIFIFLNPKDFTNAKIERNSEGVGGGRRWLSGGRQ